MHSLRNARARNLFRCRGIKNAFSRSDVRALQLSTKRQKFTKRQLDFCHGSSGRVFASSTKPGPLYSKQDVRLQYSQYLPKKELNSIRGLNATDMAIGKLELVIPSLPGCSTVQRFTRHHTSSHYCRTIFQRIITKFHGTISRNGMRTYSGKTWKTNIGTRSHIAHCPFVRFENDITLIDGEVVPFSV